jgi:hypothetical protein
MISNHRLTQICADYFFGERPLLESTPYENHLQSALICVNLWFQCCSLPFACDDQPTTGAAPV